jgi:hemin uptake protein HemP
MDEQRKPTPREPEQPVTETCREIRSWQSAELLGQANEARIVHGGEVYRLLRTRNDKLILVK